MKKITLLAIALMCAMGFAANAQCPDKAQCPDNQPQNKMRQPREFVEFAFEGILLDMDQQTRIDSLNAAVQANAPQCQAQQQDCPKAPNCDKQKCDKQKCDKQKCDKQKCDKQGENKANCPKDKGKHGKKAGKGMRGAVASPCPYGPEYIKKVKEILTPEQYTIFLENIVLNAPAPRVQAVDMPMKHKMEAPCQAQKCDKSKKQDKKDK